MSDEQKLGPRQLAWVEALESGEYAQGFRRLSCDGKYCCLGVSEVLRTGSATPYGYSLSVEGIDYLKFNERHGNIYGAELNRHTCLSDANDSGVPHPVIAAFIRANPAAVFSGEA